MAAGRLSRRRRPAQTTVTPKIAAAEATPPRTHTNSFFTPFLFSPLQNPPNSRIQSPTSARPALDGSFCLELKSTPTARLRTCCAASRGRSASVSISSVLGCPAQPRKKTRGEGGFVQQTALGANCPETTGPRLYRSASSYPRVSLPSPSWSSQPGHTPKLKLITRFSLSTSALLLVKARGSERPCSDRTLIAFSDPSDPMTHTVSKLALLRWHINRVHQ